MLEDHQGRQQFVAEIVVAKANIGKAGEGANDAVRSGIVAKIRLEAPDAHDHGLIDTVGLFGLGEPRADAVRLGAAALYPVGRNGAGDIVPDRARELRLSFRHPDDLRIEGDAGKGGVEGWTRNPSLVGKRPKRGDIFAEGIVVGMERPASGGARGRCEASQSECDQTNSHRRQNERGLRGALTGRTGIVNVNSSSHPGAAWRRYCNRRRRNALRRSRHPKGTRANKARRRRHCRS